VTLRAVPKCVNRIGILTSPEYTAKHASDADFVTDLYFQMLGR
jgi:hypothetical protein